MPRSFRVNADMVIAVLSAGLYWCWWDLTQFDSVLYGESSLSGYLVLLIISAASLIPLGLACFRPVSFSLLIEKGSALVAIGSIGSLGCALEYLGGGFSAPVAVGAFLTGVSAGAFLGAWGHIFGRRSPRGAGVCIACSVALGVVFNAFVKGLPGVMPSLAAIFVPLVCAALLFVFYRTAIIDSAVSRSERYESEAGGVLAGMRAPLVLAVSCFWFACGYFEYESSLSGDFVIQGFNEALLLPRAGVSLVFIVVSMMGWSQQRTLHAGLLLMIAGFMLLPVMILNGQAYDAGVAVIMGGYTLFDIMTWAILTAVAVNCRVMPVRVISFGMIISAVAVALGASFAHALSFYEMSVAQSASAALVVTYLLVIGSVLVLTELPKVWVSIDSADDDEKALAARNSSIADFGESRGLTKRETEVLIELLSDESISDIASKLCISINTLNSHVKKIYGKTGLHGRDKLRKAVKDWLS